MAITARESGGGGGFEKPDPGTYVARCISVIDLGTHYSQRWDYNSRKALIEWELIGERRDGTLLTIGSFYTVSLGEKAYLRKDLESWRGRPFTPEELKGFDIESVLGAPCLVNVVHNDSNGKTYANVSTVMAPQKGQQIPEPETKLTKFSLENPDWRVYESLRDGLKKKIMDSDEYKALTLDGDGPTHQPEDTTDYSLEEDVPF